MGTQRLQKRFRVFVCIHFASSKTALGIRQQSASITLLGAGRGRSHREAARWHHHHLWAVRTLPERILWLQQAVLLRCRRHAAGGDCRRFRVGRGDGAHKRQPCGCNDVKKSHLPLRKCGATPRHGASDRAARHQGDRTRCIASVSRPCQAAYLFREAPWHFTQAHSITRMVRSERMIREPRRTRGDQVISFAPGLSR
jgi:hypothetical protein